MPEKSLPFGSDEWVSHVKDTPPVRKIKSRTKRTHRHAPWLYQKNRLGYVESRNELVGILALEYLQARGEISFYKEQPFRTPVELWESGIASLTDRGSREYTPDFYAERPAGQRYVIEVKSQRFISRETEAGLERWKDIFSEHGLKFLLWTNHTPLVSHLRNNLLRMRRAAVLHYEEDELPHLLDLLQTKGPLPVWALYNHGIDIDLIAFAAWKGNVHFPLQKVLTGPTEISLKATENLADYLFGIQPDMYRWWNLLEAAA